MADKHNRKLIMIVADGAVGLISLVAGLLILAGDVSLPLLLALCIARSAGQAFHSPAMMAAMPMLVPDKHLLRINTLDQLLASIASIGAPAFGIFLYTTCLLYTSIPVVLCLDTSQSMTTNGGFDALNEGVRAFFDTCKNDPVNRLGFDVAIVTFGAQGLSLIHISHT